MVCGRVRHLHGSVLHPYGVPPPRYDGALGVLVGISAVKAMLLYAADKAGEAVAAETLPDGTLRLPPDTASRLAAHLHTPVRLVAFTDEEGVRFQSTFLGSRALVRVLVVAASTVRGLTVQDSWQLFKCLASIHGPPTV